MEYVYVGRQNDDEVIENYKTIFEKETLEELAETYNNQVRCGMTGVHRQALYLMALRQEFKERLQESPVYLLEHVLGMVGPIDVEDGRIKIRE